MRNRMMTLGLILACVICMGGHESVFTVSQPLLTNGAGIVVSDVSFIRYGTAWDRTGIHVCGTANEYLVSTRIGYENRNGASRMGVRISPILAPRDTTRAPLKRPGLFGDTLRVLVDLTEMQQQAPFPLGGPPEKVLRAMQECMILNGTREGQGVRYLDIQVEGPSQYDWLECVADLETVKVRERPYAPR